MHAVEHCANVDILDIQGLLTHALDLGCGTGLSGAAFRDRVDRLTAIDLSGPMIEQAAAKNIYDDLACAEATAYLGACEASFDLIIATDVFINVGALDALFQGLAAVTQPGAWLVCSTEHSTDGDVTLRASGRFAHSSAYMDTTAAAAGFQIKHAMDTVIRKGDDGAINGVLYLLQKA